MTTGKEEAAAPGRERAATRSDSMNGAKSSCCGSCGRPLPPTWCASCLDRAPAVPRTQPPLRLRIARVLVNALGALFWCCAQHLGQAETRHENGGCR